MYPESSEGLNRETEREVRFFTPAFYPLDNFSAHAVEVWGKVFMTAEHAYQWKKYEESDPNTADRIISATSPHAVKEISDVSKATRAANWGEMKVQVMEEILEAKTTQHEDVREVLRRTGDRRIVENSPVDDFWGDGQDGMGKNMLGEIWMKIRKNLIK